MCAEIPQNVRRNPHVGRLQEVRNSAEAIYWGLLGLRLSLDLLHVRAQE